jgi:hypothetical protein
MKIKYAVDPFSVNGIKPDYLAHDYIFITDVNISVFLKFNRIQDLTTNLQDVTNALRDSELLSVTEDGTRVFRKTPVKEKDNTDDCTIYVVSIMLLISLVL